jgi:hypothetical protein
LAIHRVATRQRHQHFTLRHHRNIRQPPRSVIGKELSLIESPMLLPAGSLALAYRLHDLAGYRRARIVRAKVDASAAIRSNLATAFRVSVCVPDFRWSATSWRSRWHFSSGARGREFESPRSDQLFQELAGVFLKRERFVEMIVGMIGPL